MKFILFAFLLLGLLAVVFKAQMPSIEPGVSLELAKWRAAHYGDVRYKLNLTLEKMSPVLKGTIEIRVKVGAGTLLSPSPQRGDIPPIILDWRKIKGFEDRSSIRNVSLNGIALSVSPSLTVGLAQPDAKARASARAISGAEYEETNEHLVFRHGVVAGENVIKLDFTSPILPSGSAITRYMDKEDGAEYIYSLFVPSDASTAFPVFDQPDLKARFSLAVRGPFEWKYVSNSGLGKEGWVSSGSTIHWNFAETKPISTYVFAFAAGPFERVEDPGGNASVNERAGRAPEIEKPSTVGRPTSTLPNGRVSARNAPGITSSQPPATAGGTDIGGAIYVRKSQAEKFKPHAAEVFRLNREAMKYFEEYFDYKFPFPKYDLVLIPEFPFGGMEHAGATFLRESAVIFPQEPTKNDLVSRATLIFHEAAHQWFGDTVTMRWFDDLWLKEGFATFTAYKALERIMPEANAWKVFYERVKQAAYQTDSTKGTTPIYQEIKNLSAAKSAYGAIVYNKAPAFLRQAEFYLGEDKFRTAVRAFLKKNEFGNAEWRNLVKEFNRVYDRRGLPEWANYWITQKGVPLIRTDIGQAHLTQSRTVRGTFTEDAWMVPSLELALSPPFEDSPWAIKAKIMYRFGVENEVHEEVVSGNPYTAYLPRIQKPNGSYDPKHPLPDLIFPNYLDYGYGIFLLDEKSRDYVLKNIHNEKDPFLRAMMWGSLWDSVREGELDPREYVDLVVKNVAQTRASARAKSGNDIPELDESTTQLLLARVSTAMNYYIPAPDIALANARASASDDQRTRVEEMLIERMRNAETLGQRITFYRAFLNAASTDKARGVLKDILNLKFEISDFKLKTKDKFDIVTRLLILGDPEAEKMLAELEKTETSDDAKRYAYAARAGIATVANKAKYWNDFTANKEISESWIEAAFGPWNSIRHSELTLPYLERALKELPNNKRSRKIFFVNGWLAAFIGGQRSEEALAIVNKFLADNPNLDKDLRLKILENADLIERAVRIRGKFRN